MSSQRCPKDWGEPSQEWIDFALGLILVKKYQAESQPEPMDRNSSLLEFRLFSGQFQGNWTQWTIEYGHPWDGVAMSRLLEASNIFEGRKQQNPHGMFVMDRDVDRSWGCRKLIQSETSRHRSPGSGTSDWWLNHMLKWWFFTGMTWPAEWSLISRSCRNSQKKGLM